jgi:hypothetical protein
MLKRKKEQDAAAAAAAAIVAHAKRSRPAAAAAGGDRRQALAASIATTDEDGSDDESGGDDPQMKQMRRVTQRAYQYGRRQQRLHPHMSPAALADAQEAFLHARRPYPEAEQKESNEDAAEAAVAYRTEAEAATAVYGAMITTMKRRVAEATERRLLQSRETVSTDRLRDQRQCAGDLKLDAIRKCLGQMGYTPSQFQRLFHNAFIRACLPLYVRASLQQAWSRPNICSLSAQFFVVLLGFRVPLGFRQPAALLPEFVEREVAVQQQIHEAARRARRVELLLVRRRRDWQNCCESGAVLLGHGASEPLLPLLVGADPEVQGRERREDGKREADEKAA